MFKKALWIKVVDLILPPRCVVSGEGVAAQGTLSAPVWGALRFLTPPLCAVCGYPFEFSTGPDSRCAPCLAAQPPFASARAAIAYDDASRDLILKFKHGDLLQAVPVLCGMMMRAGAEQIEKADVVVPVPLHRWRLLRRRYNQSALLARALARGTGRTCIPDALIRTRSTPVQGHLNAKERARNVRRAFAVNPRREKCVKGKTVLLVDDVYTTGATVSECTRALLRAGASGVHILTAARVVRGE